MLSASSEGRLSAFTPPLFIFSPRDHLTLVILVRVYTNVTNASFGACTVTSQGIMTYFTINCTFTHIFKVTFPWRANCSWFSQINFACRTQLLDYHLRNANNIGFFLNCLQQYPVSTVHFSIFIIWPSVRLLNFYQGDIAIRLEFVTEYNWSCSENYYNNSSSLLSVTFQSLSFKLS
jgi:hypothetical protein